MTCMTTEDATSLIDRIRIEREANDMARADILLAAARIANDDNAIGDPDVLVNGERIGGGGVATQTLSRAERAQWFATLIETVAQLDRLKAWRRRTTCQHHEASRALDEVIADAATRGALAVGVLLYGIPAAEDVAA